MDEQLAIAASGRQRFRAVDGRERSVSGHHVAAYHATWDYFNVTLFGGVLRKVFSTPRAAPRALASSPP